MALHIKPVPNKQEAVMKVRRGLRSLPGVCSVLLERTLAQCTPTCTGNQELMTTQLEPAQFFEDCLFQLHHKRRKVHQTEKLKS